MWIFLKGGCSYSTVGPLVRFYTGNFDLDVTGLACLMDAKGYGMSQMQNIIQTNQKIESVFCVTQLNYKIVVVFHFCV